MKNYELWFLHSRHVLLPYHILSFVSLSSHSPLSISLYLSNWPLSLETSSLISLETASLERHVSLWGRMHAFYAAGWSVSSCVAEIPIGSTTKLFRYISSSAIKCENLLTYLETWLCQLRVSVRETIKKKDKKCLKKCLKRPIGRWFRASERGANSIEMEVIGEIVSMFSLKKHYTARGKQHAHENARNVAYIKAERMLMGVKVPAWRTKTGSGRTCSLVLSTPLRASWWAFHSWFWGDNEIMVREMSSFNSGHTRTQYACVAIIITRNEGQKQLTCVCKQISAYIIRTSQR